MMISTSQLLNKMPDGFLVLDSKFKLLAANASARQMLELPQEQSGLNMLDLFFRENKAEHVSNMLLTLEEEKPFIFENGPLIVEMNQDPDGHYFVFCRKNSTETSSTEFISIASHELKTPLTALKLQVEFAKKIMDEKGIEALGPQKVETFINRTFRDVQKLTRLVEDMVDVTHLGERSLVINCEFFNLEDFMEEVIARGTQKLKGLQAQLKLQVKAPVMVNWDRRRIEQVIFNLLGNALLYGRGSQIELTVTSGGGYVYLSVKDSGPGISKEKQKKVFNKFDRGSQSREISGLGLGLYLAREIVTLHNGSISVESAPQRGSTFKIQLPVQPVLT
jgi:signal transduction histidine kinase